MKNKSFLPSANNPLSPCWKALIGSWRQFTCFSLFPSFFIYAGSIIVSTNNCHYCISNWISITLSLLDKKNYYYCYWWMTHKRKLNLNPQKYKIINDENDSMRKLTSWYVMNINRSLFGIAKNYVFSKFWWILIKICNYKDKNSGLH